MPRALKFHDVVKLNGRLHRVVLVTESRALCEPVDKQVKEIMPQTGENAGRTVKFSVTQPGVSICVESDVEIVGQWDPGTNKMRDL